jgi:hypothetical protein
VCNSNGLLVSEEVFGQENGGGDVAFFGKLEQHPSHGDAPLRGFTYRYYQRIEAGEKDHRLSTLNRLANTFKIPVRDLLDFY